MRKNRLLVSILIGVIFGIVFVYLPRQNTPYMGTISRDQWPLCLGSNTYDYGNGSQKTGFPLIDRTVYIGPCLNGLYPISLSRAILDFGTGFILAGGSIFLVTKKAGIKK